MPSKQKIVLGWEIDTRALQIYLPKGKFIDWNRDTNSYLANPKVAKKNMESLVGRLDHIAYIMDMLQHFMNRLCSTLQQSIKNRVTTLTPIEQEDLNVIQNFLDRHRQRIFPKQSIIQISIPHLQI